MFSGYRRVRRGVAVLGALLSFALPLSAQADGPSSVTAQAQAPAVTPSPAPAAESPAPPDSAPAPAAPAPAGPPPKNAPTIVSVDVSGNAHVPTSTILSVVRSRVGQPFDERIVREDLQNIFDLGYFSDQVPPLIRQRPDGIAITYRVIENPVISRIVFSGNDHVPSDTLLALMDTSVGQVLNVNTFHQDVLKINSYYDKIGYGGQVPSHVGNLEIDPKTATLNITIREGLTVAHVIIEQPPDALPLLKDSIIRPALSVKPGQPFSDDATTKDDEALKKLYDKYDLQLGDFEEGIDPTTVDLTKGTADVKVDIHVAVVGAVQITGNTVTKDVVIRRQLRLHPGMIITQGLLRRDYERLNNLGFFEKVDLNPKAGPDPKKPYEVTLDWNVKEQRTGTAQVGAGYSGGPTGQGLTGTLSYSQNNINGTGNGASIRFERGARVADASISYTVPYLGNTNSSQKYSLGASLFTDDQSNYYQVYGAGTTSAISTTPPTICPPPAKGHTSPCQGNANTVPVILTPNSDTIDGVAALYGNRANGASVNIGRRLTDYVTTSLGLTVQRLATDVELPNPYYLAGTEQILSTNNTTAFGSAENGNTLGINAPSIADTSNGKTYSLHAVTLSLQVDTRDDVFNPRRGTNTTLSEELSGAPIGSQFGYSITTFDGAKFFPVLKNSTLGFHLLAGDATGAIPPSKLFVLTDQQLRGYSEVFYGTEEILGQAELRVPVSPDRKFNIAFFTDYGGQRIRGAAPITDIFGNTVVDYNNFLYRTDAGVGLRFDVPQLGFKSIRLDFAKGKEGTHTSFGIGQSF